MGDGKAADSRLLLPRRLPAISPASTRGGRCTSTASTAHHAGPSQDTNKDTSQVTNPQIIAMGGGGFSSRPKTPALDEYILRQCPKRTPRVCFLPTASGDADEYIVRFYASFSKFACRPTHASLFRLPAALRQYLLAQDIIYVGGGNTRSMLALWREWKVHEILREAWQRGIILSGVSSGGICWFEEGLVDSLPGQLTPLQCLGFLKGSFCPHYNTEPARRPEYLKLIRAAKMRPGLAVEDGVAVHFIGHRLAHVVSVRRGPVTYAIRLTKGGLEEETLQVKSLAPSETQESTREAAKPGTDSPAQR